MKWIVTHRTFENRPFNSLGLDENQLKVARRLPHKLTVDTSDGKTIAEVCDNVDYANLIAASPELLKALKNVASALERANLVDETDAIAKAYGPLRALIAKAEGNK